MKLNTLRIERQQYGIDKDKMFGTIEFENQCFKMSVKLTEDQAYKLLDIVAESMVEYAHDTAKMLVVDLRRPQASIEGEIQ